jgi:hypothetical protein
MTPEFRKGLIAGYERIIWVVGVQRSDPKGTPHSRQALDTLHATIRIEIDHTEHEGRRRR